MYHRVLRRPKRQIDGEASVPQGQARQEDGRTFEIREAVEKPNQSKQKGTCDVIEEQISDANQPKAIRPRKSRGKA